MTWLHANMTKIENHNGQILSVIDQHKKKFNNKKIHNEYSFI